MHAKIEPGVRDELAALASANDRSIAAEIRRAVVEHVRHERLSVMAAEARATAGNWKRLRLDSKEE